MLKPELEGLDSDGLIGLVLAFVASGQSGDEDAMAEIEDMLGGVVGISVGALRRLTPEAREALPWRSPSQIQHRSIPAEFSKRRDPRANESAGSEERSVDHCRAIETVATSVGL